MVEYTSIWKTGRYLDMSETRMLSHRSSSTRSLVSGASIRARPVHSSLGAISPIPTYSMAIGYGYSNLIRRGSKMSNHGTISDNSNSILNQLSRASMCPEMGSSMSLRTNESTISSSSSWMGKLFSNKRKCIKSELSSSVSLESVTIRHVLS